MKRSLFIFIISGLVGAGLAACKKQSEPKRDVPQSAVSLPAGLSELPPPADLKGTPRFHNFIRAKEISIGEAQLVLGADVSGSTMKMKNVMGQTRMEMGINDGYFPFISLYDDKGLSAYRGTVEGTNQASVISFLNQKQAQMRFGLDPEKSQLPIYLKLVDYKGKSTYAIGSQ